MSALVFLAALNACSPYSPDLGNAPYICADTDPKCPDGYACQAIGTQNVCVDSSGVGPGQDSGPGHDSGPHGEAGGSCASPFSGVLATWTLTGQTGSQISTAAATSTSGVTAGAVQRGGALSPASGTNSINSSGWSTGALDKTKFYTVMLTAPSGCSISTTSLMLDATASGTGPTSMPIGTSADAFAATAQGSTTSAGMVSVVANGSGTLEIRFYGLGASATTGTMRIQNTLSVTGTLQ
ncbi:MAG TPA: hypothetical protein VGM90_29035 [Kofleriaceae bacterium]